MKFIDAYELLKSGKLITHKNYNGEYLSFKKGDIHSRDRILVMKLDGTVMDFEITPSVLDGDGWELYSKPLLSIGQKIRKDKYVTLKILYISPTRLDEEGYNYFCAQYNQGELVDYNVWCEKDLINPYNSGLGTDKIAEMVTEKLKNIPRQ